RRLPSGELIQQPLPRLPPDGVAMLLAEDTEVPDPLRARLSRPHHAHLSPRLGIQLQQRPHRVLRRIVVVGEAIGAQWTCIGILTVAGALALIGADIVGVPSPLRPLLGDAA